MHRSVSPDSNKKVERKSRPNSIGSSSSEVSAIQQVRDTLPLQLAISPRREQSALVSEMVVAESGGALAGGSVKALLEVRLFLSFSLDLIILTSFFLSSSIVGSED
jgi:hypothetical protein